ncbi:MAG: hypothetical protein Q9166_003036 [cf. Caloplaca sp. 2 TL-2023]
MVSTRSQKTSNILTLDKDTPIKVQYLAEGAANVVFVVRSSRGILCGNDDYGIVGTTTDDGIPRIDARLRGKLLRLRKDVPSVTPVIDSHRHFEEYIEPLFPVDTLVEQVLVNVTPEFVKLCNQSLRAAETKPFPYRPEKRVGTNLSETEPHATLITDMRWDDEHASTEFKPKWLAQSPSAPPTSKRCRTCALRAMRDVKENIKPDVRMYPENFCPLTLVADDRDAILPSLEPILVKSRGAPLDIVDFASQTLPYFHKLPLLRLLRDLQMEKDPKGVLKVDPSNLDFMTAMALRDCTFFLKIPNREEKSNARIEARLGDLDLKTPDGGKGQYWKEVEQQLIDEGWYTATEKTPAPEGRCVCLLSKGQEQWASQGTSNGNSLLINYLINR